MGAGGTTTNPILIAPPALAPRRVALGLHGRDLHLPLPSEALTLTWDRVDFDVGLVRLYGNMTKNGEARDFPFDALPELAQLLKARRAYTDDAEHVREAIIPYVFHRNGKPIRNYYGAWRKVLRLAATDGKEGPIAPLVRPHLLGRIPHDFRRTAVRNLVRAGVDEYLAMKLTGHKTRAIFDRYNITDEADLRAGVAKLAAHLAPKQKRRKGTTGGQSRLRVVGRAS